MNIRRGMFRFWVLFTTCWLIGCAIWAYNELTSTWLPYENYLLQSVSSEVVPVPSFVRTYDLGNSHYEVTTPHSMSVYVLKAIPKDEAQKRIRTFYDVMQGKREGELRKRNSEQILPVLATGGGVPAIVFVIGYALGWAFSGFRRTA